MKSPVQITVTVAQLNRIADCACRMLEYADANGSLLITILHGADGTPVRLSLDKRCIYPKAPELHDTS